MAEAVSIAAALDLLARGAGPVDSGPTADDAPVAKRAVFFVCTTKTLDREELLRTDLSQRGSAVVNPTALALDEPPLRIELLRQDNHTVIKVLAPMSQPDSFEQLTALFNSKRYSTENPSGLFPSDHPIELAPAKDVPWNDAVSAFNGLVRAGYQQIHFVGPR